MPDKRKILLDSVKRLIELNISDKEIVKNLEGVGINESLARELIAEAKGKELPPVQKQKPGEISEAQKRSPREVYDEISDDLSYEGAETSQREIEEETHMGKEELSKPKPAVSDSKDIAELWRAGILTTIDNKLNEMQRLHDETQKVIDEKIAKGLEKELKKIKVLLDSQKTLFLGKIDSELERKGKELAGVLEGKLQETKEAAELTRQNILKLEKSETKEKKVLDEIEAKFSALEKTKTGMIRDINKAIIQSQTKVEKLVTETQEKLDTVDERVNRSLELESKVAEGLLKDAQTKIDRLSFEKSHALESELTRRMKKIDDMSQKVKPEVIDRKLAEIDRLKERLAAENKEKIRQIMNELNIFKEQFVVIIKKNIANFNQTKKELVETIKTRDKAIDEHLKAIDAKMKELTEFEKKFAQEMGLLIEKMPSEKSKKTKKKN